MQMNISIIHPSRGRPIQAFKTVTNWIQRADISENLTYFLMVDKDDPSLVIYQSLGAVIVNFEGLGAINAINLAAKISIDNLFIVVSDDMDCPNHWDTLLLEALAGKEDFCVKTNDGFQRVIMTLPIMDRKYYDRFGYIYYPGYEHMYADTEMTAVAHMLGRNITLNIPFTHNHYLAGRGKKDAINEKNNRTFLQGRRLFDERKVRNFDLINPVKQFTEIRLK